MVYVYNVLRLAKDEQEDMLKLNQVYRLKEYFGPPDRYLGANIDKVRSMNCVEYMCGSIQNVDSILEGNKADLNLFGYVHRPYPSSYRPELDVINELDEELTSRFQQAIGVLRYSIELSRIYIMADVSC